MVRKEERNRNHQAAQNQGTGGAEMECANRPITCAIMDDIGTRSSILPRCLQSQTRGARRGPRSLRALVFDAYGTLFDVHSVIALCEQLWPSKGAALSQLWRAKQLEYTWQRSLMQWL